MRQQSTVFAGGNDFIKKPNCLSIFFFWYSLPIFQTGMYREFEEEDLTVPLPQHMSSDLGDKLSYEWARRAQKNISNHKKVPGIFTSLFKVFGCEIMLYGLALFFMEIFLRMLQPVFVGLILMHFSWDNYLHRNNETSPTYFARIGSYWSEDTQPAISLNEVAVFAFGMVFCSFLAVLILHPVFCQLNYCGMKIRIAVCSLIYRKILRLDASLLTGQTIGNIINILSNDVNRFENIHFIHYLWLGPSTVLAALFFLYMEVGQAAFVGMIPVMCLVPLQCILGTLTKYVRINTAAKTDNRVQVMNEILSGIRIIKMYAWEYTFSKSVDNTRRKEMHSLIYASLVKGVIMSLILFTTRSCHYITTYWYLKSHSTISIATIFYIVSYYQILRMTMTVYFPQGVGHISEIIVALKRIKDFLHLPEMKIVNPEPMDPDWANKLRDYPNYEEYFHRNFIPFPEISVIITRASLKYGEQVVLHNINLMVTPGQLTALTGAVGSGKSCMLHMVMGELSPFEGDVHTNGKISYASQDPFLFAGTVRQNILFGDDYDREKYSRVIRACALQRDFSILPFGDRTMVGEKGISLSGGQRARINLARAVYREADIYLLDDPLSAVDTNVGKHLFEECITGYLSEKVVILTTHQLQYLKACKQVVFLEHGKIKVMGTYSEVYNTLERIVNLIPQEENDGAADALQKKEKSILNIKSSYAIVKKQQSAREYKEVKGTGTVGCVNLVHYYRSGGNWFFVFLLILLFILTQVAASVFDYFMTIWARIEDNRWYDKPRDEIPKLFRNFERPDISTYAAGAVISTMIVALFRSYYFYTFCMFASISLHNKMFNCVTRANLRFFTLNPSGRILNRFSKDMGAVDEMLPYAMVDTYQILLNFVGIIGLLPFISIWLLIITIVVVLILHVIRRYYLKCSVSLKRLEGVARSPVFTHASATMQGLAVIRVHGNEMLLVTEFDKFQDTHTCASYLFMAASRAFGYIMDLITVIYTTIVIYFLIYYEENSANIGLITTQAIGLTGIFQWGMRQSAEFETQLAAVERVLEYTKLEPEPPLQSEEGMKPPDSWPSQGKIEFINVIMRYALSEPPILQGVNMTILPREKIGIVGRTGAGKSSIIQCLFRLAYIEGSIIIDGIDTSTIGLHDLRKKLSIIPQEPLIFSGTLRYNLDPFNEYSDVVLYSALVDVDLQNATSPECLNEMMSDGGANLSVGSRQLVCLARAIVRNNKILIMDEATANVDIETDYFIQKTIREKFEECTVLTIAHRLNTIMDSDRVLVLEAGKIMEFEHPHILMSDPNSMFTQLVNKTGAHNVERFKFIARETYNKKQQMASENRN